MEYIWKRCCQCGNIEYQSEDTRANYCPLCGSSDWSTENMETHNDNSEKPLIVYGK